jgi:hypothetical protein
MPARLVLKKPRKYRNKPAKAGEITFASKKEANRWIELNLLEDAGKIRDLERQVKYAFRHNGVKICEYVCDFRYWESRGKGRGVDGDWVIEDCKGFRTREYEIKKKLMLAFYGHEIRET